MANHRLFLVPGRAARGSAYLRKFACGRDDLALVNRTRRTARAPILGRASGTISLTGLLWIDTAPPEDTFLGDTDPRSRPMLEASRADRHAGRETCQRPGGRAEQRKSPSSALGLPRATAKPRISQGRTSQLNAPGYSVFRQHEKPQRVQAARAERTQRGDGAGGITRVRTH